MELLFPTIIDSNLKNPTFYYKVPIKKGPSYSKFTMEFIDQLKKLNILEDKLKRIEIFINGENFSETSSDFGNNWNLDSKLHDAQKNQVSYDAIFPEKNKINDPIKQNLSRGYSLPDDVNF